MCRARQRGDRGVPSEAGLHALRADALQALAVLRSPDLVARPGRRGDREIATVVAVEVDELEIDAAVAVVVDRVDDVVAPLVPGRSPVDADESRRARVDGDVGQPEDLTARE